MEITLALGGGGVRGIAHVGVLRVLDLEGFKIKAIAGTSAGGLAGALYAAGFTPDEMVKILKTIDQTKMFSRLSTKSPSLMGFGGMTKLLKELLDGKNFEDLKIPFAVTATDADTGQETIFRKGSVLQAVLATSAVPGIFPPGQVGTSLMFDGAVLDPVPVAVARWLAPNLPVVAVVVSSINEPFDYPSSLPIQLPGPAPLIETFSRLRIAQAFNLFVRSVEISQQALTEMRLEIDCPDVIIRPKLAGFPMLKPVNVDTVVALGERAARQHLPELHKAVSWRARLERQLHSFAKNTKTHSWREA